MQVLKQRRKRFPDWPKLRMLDWKTAFSHCLKQQVRSASAASLRRIARTPKRITEQHGR